ncbi:MAG TPA: bacteriohemerythrin [Bryobacteraceae bacterium]|nr:bacteriohemerythrin [Bryobacteraceae bacterium]
MLDQRTLTKLSGATSDLALPAVEATVNPFVWSDSHSLGLPEVDVEHRALFRLAEQLYDDVAKGQETDKLASNLARLASYASFHFENEEALMQRTDFPEIAEHRLEHQTFIAQVANLESLRQDGHESLCAPLLEFLRAWTEQHIHGADRRLAEHVKRASC